MRGEISCLQARRGHPRPSASSRSARSILPMLAKPGALWGAAAEATPARRSAVDFLACPLKVLGPLGEPKGDRHVRTTLVPEFSMLSLWQIARASLVCVQNCTSTRAIRAPFYGQSAVGHERSRTVLSGRKLHANCPDNQPHEILTGYT